MAGPKLLEPAVIDEDPRVYEAKNVHDVYNEIASHFSSTRYKPWPIIAAFLSSIPTGWVGLDSGTGNGKYLPLPSDRPGEIWTIGLDRSRNLLDIARNAGGAIREVIWGDVLDHCWRAGAFDFVISIATIHHLATPQRRKMAVECIIRSLSASHGRALIYVWAVEQDELSKRKVLSETENDSSDSKGKDVVVPWVLSTQPKRESREDSTSTPKIFNRYYHMFAKDELLDLVAAASADLSLHLGVEGPCANWVGEGLEIVQAGWERSNYYVELRRWQLK